jgi:FlaA1/EpsC-like NDP-sugar epimerase/lipopolysaccharide/colanic/teichoic acid biosynthesis glycosyltransferase
MKRIFDIILSLIGLVLVTPVIAAVSLLIKLEGPGPVFFSHKRIGRNFKSFKLYKFRSMIEDAPKKGLPITAEDDPRVTRIGRFLRKSKIDELPQLFNVLKGDMSFVGPRPEVKKYVDKFKKEYKEILKVRPGITDYASLYFSDEESILKGRENPEEYYLQVLLPEKIRLAREYIRDASIYNDMKLIFLTVFKVFYPVEAINKTIKYFSPYRTPIILLVQFAIIILSNYLAFFIRFEGNIPAPEFDLFLRYIPLLLVMRGILIFSLDRGLWKYVSVNDLLKISTLAAGSSILFFISVRYISGNTSYPISIYVLDCFLTVFFRLHSKSQKAFVPGRKRLVIIGAGDAAEMFLRDVEKSSFYDYEIVGLVDDNPAKKGFYLRNVPIMGTRKDIPAIIKEKSPDVFMVAIPSASQQRLMEIIKDIRQHGKPVKVLPGLWDILSGKDSISSIKNIEPEDFLFRAPIRDGSAELKNFFTGKSVMITGAGGSIGSELSRQIASFDPMKLVLFERHEENLYKIDMELNERYSHTEGLSPDGCTGSICPVIGDILDEKRLSEAMTLHKPQIVFHAAAYKHVPLMESNPNEAFKTNVLGTKAVAEAASQHGVEKFVSISTDKAVNPSSVMGKSKKIAEEIIKNLAMKSPATKNIIVRFGNVLDSSGSVVPLFRKQIRNGGPVTVTHPEVTRYFMTIPEAVELVLQSAVLGTGGEIFVLDMGRPVRIVDLARRMISLYGYRPGIDIEIVFTGLRPGEKLSEELYNGNELVEKTSHPKINKAVSTGESGDIIPLNLGELTKRMRLNNS